MDAQTLDSLADMICGDGQGYPVYRSGSELTRFFYRVGFSNFRHDGSTRKWWTLSVLNQLTENNLKALVLRLADPREYRGNEAQVSHAIRKLNEILMVEGLKVDLVGVTAILKEITPQFVRQPEEPELQPLPPPDFLNLKLEPGLGQILANRWDQAQKCLNAGAHLAATIYYGLNARGNASCNPTEASQGSKSMWGSPTGPADRQGEILC